MISWTQEIACFLKKSLARPEGNLQEEVEVELNPDGCCSFERDMCNTKSQGITRKEDIRAYKERQDQVKCKKLSEELLKRDYREGTPLPSFTR